MYLKKWVFNNQKASTLFKVQFITKGKKKINLFQVMPFSALEQSESKGKTKRTKGEETKEASESSIY